MVGCKTEELPILAGIHLHQPRQTMTNLKLNQNIRTSANVLTSDRYNRGQLYKEPSNSYLFTVDWFQANCLHGLNKGLLRDFDFDDVQESYECFHTTLRKDVKTGDGTKMYKHGFDVSFNNQSVGLLLLSPRQSFKDEYSCSLKLHNHILYQKGWTLIVDALLDDIGLKINNFTRIDIACDGSGFMSQYQKLNQGIYQNVGRAHHCNYQTSKNVLTGFDIGSKRSDKYVTGYLKGKRLVADNKTYISDYWAKNNLTVPFDKVERLELKMKNKAIKSIASFDYTRLEDSSYLASIYRTQLDGFYQFVKTTDIEKDRNVTRAKRIDVIDWDKIELTKVVKMNKVKKPSSIWAAKRYITFGLQMIHAGHYPAKNLFDNEEYMRLKAVADEYEITHWFENLNTRIAKRDKTQIAEMRYNRMEIEAGGRSIHFDKHH